MTETSWIVHKFGGTSVASAERYRGVIQILAEARATQPRQAVVVSAMSGVTDMLVGLVRAAAAREPQWRDQLRAITEREERAIEALLDGEALTAMLTTVRRDLSHIEELCQACELLRSASPEAHDLIVGHGELWSAQLLCAALQATGARVAWLDAREVIVVEPRGQATPLLLMAQSQERMDAWLEAHDAPLDTLIITGFVASTRAGLATTLGRNGSDYSASIFSALLRAQELTIWTDVDGVLSANPRQVPEAVVLDALSYQEAMELAYFGAKVLHPSTIAPAVAGGVAIWIKNTFAPQRPGTRIDAHGSDRFAVKGFATIEGVSLVNLEGTTLIGVPGIAQRLFGALRDAGVNVIMISQASSEHSICFVVQDADVDRTREVVEAAFFAERVQGQLQSLDITSSCAVLAVVGDHMAGQPGIAARFFSALGKAQVSVRAIAQGSSERNISVVVNGADATRALRAAHAGFYLSHQALSVGLIGPGQVGAELLSQLHEQADALRAAFNVEVRLRGVITRGAMALEDQGIALSQWREALDAGQPPALEAMVEFVDSDYLPHAVIIDCSASDDVAARYPAWLDRGIHIITPNKKAGAGELERYEQIKRKRAPHVHFLYETTVGAGLPIIHTVRELMDTGDRIEAIEGVLSGTLSFLLNSYDGSVPFSALVREARRLGYTEPDPREDLSGLDVARKVVILAREVGLALSLEDVTIEGLVPEGLEGGDVTQFLSALEGHDDAWLERLSEARERGEVLRFVGQLTREGAASVGLRAYPSVHPLARVQGTDNMVLIRSRRYSKNPLVVQGPGAGPAVTAGGVFADLLRLSSYLGATR